MGRGWKRPVKSLFSDVPKRASRAERSSAPHPPLFSLFALQKQARTRPYTPPSSFPKRIRNRLAC
eukprot:2419983-Prymnesium_polylepis.1